MSSKIKRFAIAGLLAFSSLLCLWVPTYAAQRFDAYLQPWQAKTWVSSGNKNSGAKTFYVQVLGESPNGGHFWVDDGGGNFIGAGVDVNAGESKWSAYQGAGIWYGGYATMYGREIGNGPFVDHVIGWVNLNG